MYLKTKLISSPVLGKQSKTGRSENVTLKMEVNYSYNAMYIVYLYSACCVVTVRVVSFPAHLVHAKGVLESDCIHYEGVNYVIWGQTTFCLY